MVKYLKIFAFLALTANAAAAQTYKSVDYGTPNPTSDAMCQPVEAQTQENVPFTLPCGEDARNKALDAEQGIAPVTQRARTDGDPTDLQLRGMQAVMMKIANGGFNMDEDTVVLSAATSTQGICDIFKDNGINCQLYVVETPASRRMLKIFHTMDLTVIGAVAAAQ